MKIRVAKTWNPIADSYQLTKKEIESQVLSDLSKYRQKYYEKYKTSASLPIDVDNFVQEMWGFTVSFEYVEQNTGEDEILGFLRPETKEIVVSDHCTNEKRISFTIAHEAGHLALHAPLFEIKDGIISGWKSTPLHSSIKKSDAASIRREWQANVYAGALLASKIEVENFLEELGLLKNNILTPFKLSDYFSKFEGRFGLSKQALEIRFEHLNIPLIKSNTI